jgi:L-rhamnose mutarotase
MKTFCVALDLHEDPALIEEYKRYHGLENIWPPVLQSIRANGVVSEEIYLASNRLFMILHTTNDFSLVAKVAAGAANADMRR